MRFTRTSLLAGGAALLAAGTAAAAADRLHKIEVALPDGSTAHIEYAGEVAPKVTVEQAEPQTRIAYDPFAALDRIAFEMRARHEAMMRQMAAMQQAAARAATATPGAVTPGLVSFGSLPAGAQVSYFSSTTDASGCTRTVRYSSDGSGAEPRVTRASAGNCDAAAEDAAPTPATAPAPRRLDDKDV